MSNKMAGLEELHGQQVLGSECLSKCNLKTYVTHLHYLPPDSPVPSVQLHIHVNSPEHQAILQQDAFCIIHIPTKHCQFCQLKCVCCNFLKS